MQLDGALQHQAEDLKNEICGIEVRATDWLSTKLPAAGELPSEVTTDVPTWTIQELYQAVNPLYPRSQKIKRIHSLFSLINTAIRRVPNPDYKNRFSKNPREAAQYLYDRTDALLFIANEWGGNECCLQAALAKNELGWLRDPRFVFPVLDSADFNQRLAAVACLGFLWSDEGNKRLRSIAINDPDPGVRQSALWAYGFACGEGTHEILKERSKDDIDQRVRSFAEELLEKSKETLWVL